MPATARRATDTRKNHGSLRSAARLATGRRRRHSFLGSPFSVEPIRPFDGCPPRHRPRLLAGVSATDRRTPCSGNADSIPVPLPAAPCTRPPPSAIRCARSDRSWESQRHGRAGFVTWPHGIGSDPTEQLFTPWGKPQRNVTQRRQGGGVLPRAGPWGRRFAGGAVGGEPAAARATSPKQTSRDDPLFLAARQRTLAE